MSTPHPGDRWFILPIDHPYVRNFQCWSGRDRVGWSVIWRDFHTTKQERSFSTEAEARRFAALLRIGPHCVSGEHIEASHLWRMARAAGTAGGVQ
jgi:hypothetical protein